MTFLFLRCHYKYVKKFKLNFLSCFLQKTIDKIVLFLGSGGSRFKRRRASISSVFTTFVRGLVYVIQIRWSSKLISKECLTLFHSLSHDFSQVSVVVFIFIFGLNFIFLCFKVIIRHYHTPKQRKIKLKPRIKLNHNICERDDWVLTKWMLQKRMLIIRLKWDAGSSGDCHLLKEGKSYVCDITVCRASQLGISKHRDGSLPDQRPH